MKDCFGTIFQLLSLLKLAHSCTIFLCCNIVIDYIHNILFQGPHHLYRGLNYMDRTHLKVMTALVIGQPITKEVAASKVTCVILIWKKSLFSFWTWTKSPVSFWFEQSHLCHFVYKQIRSKFDLTDIPILSSEKLTSETSDMQVESQTSDKGTWDKMDVMIGFYCTGYLFFVKLLRSFQRKSVCKAENAITMVPDWGLG